MVRQKEFEDFKKSTNAKIRELKKDIKNLYGFKEEDMLRIDKLEELIKSKD